MPPKVKRACQGTTKAGKPCNANPLTSSDFCVAHSDAKTRESLGFIPNNGKAGRPKNPRAVDILRERLERDADAVLSVLWDGLEAQRAIVVGAGESATLEEVKDHAVRISAAREILDRVYGRPRQATEISGPDGGPVEVVDTSDPETVRALHALLGRRPASR